MVTAITGHFISTFLSKLEVCSNNLDRKGGGEGVSNGVGFCGNYLIIA